MTVSNRFNVFFSEESKKKISDNWNSLSAEAKAQIASLDQVAQSYENFVVEDIMK